jgi:hypothetical protein
MITGGHIFVLCLILLLIYLLFNKSKREKYEYKKYPINVSWTNGDGTFSMVTKWIVVVVTPDGTEYTTETNSLEDRKDGSTVNLTVNDVVLKPGNNKITVKLLFDDLYGRKNIQFHKYEVEQIVYDDYENVVKIDNFEGCYEGEWTNNGSCSSEGKQTQTRALVGATCSDDLVAEREIDCCYQTEWVGNTCTPDGKIRQTREAAGNCDDLSTEREELDCCYEGEWANSGSCSSEGKQTQTRALVGATCSGDSVTEREIDCCYTTNWVESGVCEVGNKMKKTREAIGECNGVSTEEYVYCCYESDWEYRDCYGNWPRYQKYVCGYSSPAVKKFYDRGRCVPSSVGTLSLEGLDIEYTRQGKPFNDPGIKSLSSDLYTYEDDLDINTGGEYTRTYKIQREPPGTYDYLTRKIRVRPFVYITKDDWTGEAEVYDRSFYGTYMHTSLYPSDEWRELDYRVSLYERYSAPSRLQDAPVFDNIEIVGWDFKIKEESSDKVTWTFRFKILKYTDDYGQTYLFNKLRIDNRFSGDHVKNYYIV